KIIVFINKKTIINARSIKTTSSSHHQISRKKSLIERDEKTKQKTRDRTKLFYPFFPKAF
ncbi:MAG: hypothetical protein OXN83_02450, partial [Oligoflexia bacterium]|nr:hypothetical protein [Oligoflexia bacterium]